MYLRLIISFILTFYVNLIFTQNVDSLLSVLNNEQNDSVKIELNQLIGKKYFQTSIYDSAFMFYNNANMLAIKTYNLYKISETLHQKGNVEYWVGNHKNADSLYKRAILASKLIDDPNLSTNIYNSYGSNCLKLNDTTEAIKALNIALGFCTNLNLTFKGNIYANFGQIYRGKNKLDSSLYYFKLSEDIWKKLDKGRFIGRIQFELGKIYFIQQKYNKSIEAIQLSLKTDTTKQNKTIRLWKHKHLSNAYAAINKYDSAYYYFNLHYEVYRQVFNEDVNIQIKKIELDSKKKSKEQENKSLLNNNKLQRQVIETRGLLIIIGIVITLTILVVLILLFLNRKKLHDTNKLLLIKNNEVQKQKEELELLNQQMFASNIKIDQQNIEVTRKNKEINTQKDELVQKTVDLLVLNRELRMNIKLREGLTNMIVHDLKNPISNIINLSENKEISFFANEILTLVENILDIQKFEGSIMSLKKSSFSLKSIVIDAIKQISLFAERKNIKIHNKIKNSIIVYADEEILRRVIVNFLSNSIKYSYVNKTIILDFEIKNGEVIIKIIDSGIGIQKDKIKLIFNKFSQIIAKKTGSARSTGLGLTFCKMAIKAHGGQINVDSEREKLTVFSFNIELSKKTFTDNKEIIEINKENKIIIDNSDKLFLKPFYNELNECDVYEIGKLRKILKRIDNNYSLGVDIWKKELNKAIYNCNFGFYKELINKIN